MKTYEEIKDEVNEVHPCSEKEAAMLYAEQFKPQWIHVSAFIPEKGKHYFALIKAISGAYIKCVAIYTDGWDLEVDCDGTEDYLNFKESTEHAFMKKGWYEECEQDGHQYDHVYMKRDVVFVLDVTLPN